MEDARGHVDEARGTHHVGEVECSVKVDAQRSQAGGHVVPELDNRVGRREGVVVALWAVVDFLQFEPGAGLEVANRGHISQCQ